MIALRKSANLPLFDIRCFNPVYYDDFMIGTSLGTDENTDEEHIFDQLQYFELESDNSEPHAKPRYDSQPTCYNKTRESTDLLAELISSAPAHLRDDYISHITKLCDIVRAGQPISSIVESAIPCEENCSNESSISQPSIECVNSSTNSSNTSNSSQISGFTPSAPAFYFSDVCKSFLRNNEMLDNDIIDSFVSLILKNHEFQCQSVARSATRFNPVDCTMPNFQIHHLEGRTHFVLTSLTTDLTIELYDSCPTDYLDDEFMKQLEQLYPKFRKIIRIVTQKQENGVDCGLFALANLYALVLGRNISSISYLPGMRKHLLSCLENKSCKEFPYKGKPGKRGNPIEKDYDINKTYSSVENLSSVVFCAGANNPGRPRLKKQRRFEPSYNKK